MRKLLIILAMALMVVISACSQDKPPKEERLVWVKGGSFVDTKSNYHGTNVTLPDFYIGKYEVTQQEWLDVMGNNPSQFQGDKLPVESVTWYDAVEYCNQRSIKEGLDPYYNIDKNTVDPNNTSDRDFMKWTVTANEGVNGYRLPTEAEWEYAAGGGQMSKSTSYSGSNKPEDVAWYWRNSGDQFLTGDWNWPAIENNHSQTRFGGLKQPNELGLYDMSGNVREWCWNWYGEAGPDNSNGSLRLVKGGGWIGGVNNTEVAFRGKFEASSRGNDQGFRVVRSR
ncbi:SUMF1/EgtB/PvdO family nonheme iron enzyme [Paenibacillus tritici]|uniref:SUMF1/EgtB/PvdO family nonheme iron enzyme n=1 Tax=Paenibacillus tritici TaxID=1873425 RepID=A0ABX2DUH7_9BACL|nr:SUMF1/EgtB/PvdO family nonheme iron enzyme [Paenibacillus tritici]NQX48341.1 SUMF1/EgtB/PvdO family nonheme iron enzyme [Paenibacillus tritici]QUL55727.1 SUMF1/EgtB/PvdO family nonheme iron enzyme [Paenibacillus tritici]